MRTRAHVGSLLIALTLAACTGGQTGTPDGNGGFPDVDAGCRRELGDADAETPFGHPPSALLAAFAGTHQLQAYWVELSPPEPGAPPLPFPPDSFADPKPESAVALTIAIAAADKFRLPPARCENRLSAPIEIGLRTDDGLVDAHFSGLLIGMPSHARIEIEPDDGAPVTGTIELGARELVDLVPLGDQRRRLIAPWPCGHEQLALDDPSWGIPPATILAALNGRVDDVRFDPAADVRLRLDLTPARETACSDESGAGYVPVQLTLSDAAGGQLLLSVLGTFGFGAPCASAGVGLDPSDPDRPCSALAIHADALPAIETWRFWPAPPVDPQRLMGLSIVVSGEYLRDGSLSGEGALDFSYYGGTPMGAYTGARWTFD